jgi:hypothetical protein
MPAHRTRRAAGQEGDHEPCLLDEEEPADEAVGVQVVLQAGLGEKRVYRFKTRCMVADLGIDEISYAAR